jgi:hypothetical protein
MGATATRMTAEEYFAVTVEGDRKQLVDGAIVVAESKPIHSSSSDVARRSRRRSSPASSWRWTSCSATEGGAPGACPAASVDLVSLRRTKSTLGADVPSFGEHVPARPAVQAVAAVAAVEGVVAGAALDAVVAGIAEHGVVATARLDAVVALTGADHVVP